LPENFERGYLAFELLLWLTCGKRYRSYDSEVVDEQPVLAMDTIKDRPEIHALFEPKRGNYRETLERLGFYGSSEDQRGWLLASTKCKLSGYDD
jgi:hypothetical protein